MPFCEKCGKEIKDGDRFCTRCGAEVKSLPMTSVNEKPTDIKSDKKSKKKLVVIISAASAVAVVLAVCAIVFVPKMFRNNENEQYKPLQTIEITTQQETTQQSSTIIQMNRKALMTAQVMLTMITYCLTVIPKSLQVPTWQDLMQMSLNSHEMKFMPEQDEDSIRTTYKIILTINGGMWERLNPKISPRICSMMLKSIMLISFEIMRKNMLSSI